ncbi:abc transporter c family member 10 [Quercus suber]|uniref:Abc transporter c family member 10 n=1 Tax=Quercus suber TaxID=58331 RepID=A0AAW0MAU9_QUESU
MKTHANENVTPFAKAGFLSKMSIWRLNPLTKHGEDKILQENDLLKQKKPLNMKAMHWLECSSYQSVIDSLSERQWFFQTRLIGLQLRSFLSAAIYQK